MAIRGPDIDTPNDDRLARSTGISTPTKKFDARTGKRVPDAFQAIGGAREISDAELRSWERGKRL